MLEDCWSFVYLILFKRFDELNEIIDQLNISYKWLNSHHNIQSTQYKRFYKKILGLVLDFDFSIVRKEMLL